MLAGGGASGARGRWLGWRRRPVVLGVAFRSALTLCRRRQRRTRGARTARAPPHTFRTPRSNPSRPQTSQEIAEHKGIPSFWVDSAARIDVAGNKLLHKTGWGELKETTNWLCDGPLTIGITSGASTPDRAIEEVLDKVFRIKDPGFAGIAPKQCATVATPEDEEE